LSLLAIKLVVKNLMRNKTRIESSEMNLEIKNRVPLNKISVNYIAASEPSNRNGVTLPPHPDLTEIRNRLEMSSLFRDTGRESGLEEGDIILIPENFELRDLVATQVFTAYKTVDKKIKPISGTFPQEALVRRSFPHDPLEDLRNSPKIPQNLFRLSTSLLRG
jgi:hypothetical protein